MTDFLNFTNGSIVQGIAIKNGEDFNIYVYADLQLLTSIFLIIMMVQVAQLMFMYRAYRRSR